MGNRNGKGLFLRRPSGGRGKADWTCCLCSESAKGHPVILAFDPNRPAGDSMSLRAHLICALADVLRFADVLEAHGFEIPEQFRELADMIRLHAEIQFRLTDAISAETPQGMVIA